MGKGSQDSARADRVGAEDKPRVRPVLIVALVLTVVVAFGVVAFFVRQDRVRRAQVRQAEAAQGRQQRVSPAAIVALPPLPVKVPLIERAGKHKNGTPRSYVDRAGLRALLLRGKYPELTQYLERFQRDFEADYHAEYFINDSAEAFESPERELEPRLDAWVSATPDSFAPYLARASHRVAVGVAQRGSAYATKTEKENFLGMNAAFAMAFADLEQVLSKNPRVIRALRDQLRIAFIGSEHHAQFRPLAQRAFALCPGCFQVRVSFLVGLEPRWGGSYQEMAQAVRAAPLSANPRFAVLSGYADSDRAQVAIEAGDLESALQYIERACARGEEADFLRVRADILARKNQPQLALESITSGLELRPHDERLLLDRARAYTRSETQDWRAAYLDLILALQLDPAAQEARNLLPYVAKGLTALGWKAHQEGREEEAIRLLDQAAELAPTREIEGRRLAVLTSGFDGSDQAITKLESEAKSHPHDFYAHARLDYALSKRREWIRIAAMWNGFIQANPENGRAYYERGGTLHQLGHSDASRADLARACELGVSAACARAGSHAPN